MASPFNSATKIVTTSTEVVIGPVPTGETWVLLGLRFSNGLDEIQSINCFKHDSSSATNIRLIGKDATLYVGTALNAAEGERRMLLEGDYIEVSANVDGSTTSPEVHVDIGYLRN